MAFIEPNWDSHIVDSAGDALVGYPEGIDVLAMDELYYLDVVNNWRASHAYPLNTFQMTLRKRTKRVDPHGLVAQRIKRLASIEDKLRRYDWLKLSEMQDIAGCRVIVSSVEQVYELSRGYKASYRGHKLIDEDDYIAAPKASGYRGYHLIYRYFNGKVPAYNDLKVEMQLRSALQHCWATAVEVVDIYLREGLKANRGSDDWRRFFALMGSAIAVREKCRQVPRTPRLEGALRDELRMFVEKLQVLERLETFGSTLNVISNINIRGLKYVILVLDPSANTIAMYGYRASELEEATARYAVLERHKSEGADAVLVSVSDAANLRRAYPNYFLDTRVFLDAVRQAIS